MHEKYQFTLHYIANKHHCTVLFLDTAILRRRSFHQPRCMRHGWSHFSPACCQLSQAGETRFLPILAGEASYPWAVYCEVTASVTWKRGWQQWGGTIIPVYSWHTHSKCAQKHKKCIKTKLFISAATKLRRPALCVNLLIYRRKFEHVRGWGPLWWLPWRKFEHVRRAPFVMAALLSDRYERLSN